MPSTRIDEALRRNVGSARLAPLGGAVLSLTLVAALLLMTGARSPVYKEPIAEKGPGLNVRAFGATGNGRTDDAPAIQAAINEALAQNDAVYLPPGQYRITRTLELSRPEGRIYSSLIGASLKGVTIVYDGDPREPVVRIRGGYGIAVHDLALEAASTDRKPSAGIAFPADAAHPSASLCTFERIRIDNCHVGFDFNRGTDRQVSEMTFTACAVSGADEAAYRVEGWNALNYLYLNCGASGCGVGWWVERTNSVTIVGGSCSEVGTVLRAAAGGNISMRGTRAETSRRLADLGPVLPSGQIGITGAAIQTTIEDASFKPLPGQMAPDGHAIRISNPGPTRIENCYFRSGDIEFAASQHTHGVLTGQNCVFDETASHGVRIQGAGDTLLDLRGCRILNMSADGRAVGILDRRQRIVGS
jgi:hypothetical protein